MDREQKDERRLLTLESIVKDLKREAILKIVGLVLVVTMFAFVCTITVVSFVATEWTAPFPRAWAVAPFALLLGYLSLFVIYQIVITVRECRTVFGCRYRIAADTLYKISEGESECLSYFSPEHFGPRRRRYKGRDVEVTAYYFEQNGRATSRQIALGDYSFEGDVFYLLIYIRDGKIVRAYNAKFYRLESEDSLS